MKVLILLSLMSVSTVWAGQGKGGGDVVRCEFDGEQTYMTLDSAIMRDQGIYQDASYEDSQAALESIGNKLNEELPKLGKNFKIFLKTFKERKNTNSSVLWIKGIPKDLKDENLHVEIPSHCEEEIQQVVVYSVKKLNKHNWLHRYFFNEDLMNELKGHRDELSWILVHEWLRSYITDASIIRIVNSYIHSEEFQGAVDTNILSNFESLGIDKNDLGLTMTELSLREKYALESEVVIDELLSLENKIKKIKNNGNERLSRSGQKAIKSLEVKRKSILRKLDKDSLTNLFLYPEILMEYMESSSIERINGKLNILWEEFLYSRHLLYWTL